MVAIFMLSLSKFCTGSFYLTWPFLIISTLLGNVNEVGLIGTISIFKLGKLKLMLNHNLLLGNFSTPSFQWALVLNSSFSGYTVPFVVKMNH